MTIIQWLGEAIQKLKSASVPTAQLDAEVLLADLLDKDRSWLHAHPEEIIQGGSLELIDEKIERRASHEPLAYIRGKQEFYGREFMVSPDTLTPRPETETMVEMLLEHFRKEERGKRNEAQIIDVGTGSGCIIISAALEQSSILNPQSSISFIGLDISEPALEIAKNNAEKLKANVKFQKFDLFSDDLTSVFNPQSSIFVLANLPYVPDSYNINLAASHEPPMAIFGGKDGLDYYRVLFKQLRGEREGLSVKENYTQRPTPYTLVLTEALPPQHIELAKIAKNAGFKLQKTQDFIQLFERIKTTK